MKNSTSMKLTCLGLVIGMVIFGSSGLDLLVISILATLTGCTGMICQSIEKSKEKA